MPRVDKQGAKEYFLRMKLQRRLPILKPSEIPALGLLDVVDEYVDRHKPSAKPELVTIFLIRNTGEYFKMRKKDTGLA